MSLTSFKLSENLTNFPNEIFDLAESLEILDLSGNQLNHLPDSFSKFKNLKIAFFSDNNFTVFPEILSKCENLEMIAFKSNKIESIPENSFPAKLRWLILTNNRLKAIPKSIGKCERLEKLMLAGNQLTALPSEISKCENLRLLRISANRFSSFPEVVFTLPNLAWLAFAGNSFNKSLPQIQSINEIDWNDLNVLEKLGEGASGMIYKASWNSKGIDVAVKIFKGGITSDGYPEDEMGACIAAKEFETLIPVLGKLKNHPENKNGLVLKLIDKSFVNLGLPPDFKTCTRDVFTAETKFGCRQIQMISIKIANTINHLHHQAITHGDLYAHNILINNELKVIFGDFGAASFFDSSISNSIEKIELRAFGYLMDDLLKNVKPEEIKLPIFTKLREIKDDCLFQMDDYKNGFLKVIKRLEEI